MGVEGVAFTAAKFDGNDDLIEIVGSEADAITTYAWNFEDGKTTDWSFSDGAALIVPTAERNERPPPSSATKTTAQGTGSCCSRWPICPPTIPSPSSTTSTCSARTETAAARTSTGSRRPTASPSTAISCWTRTSPTTRRARSANISAFPRTDRTPIAA
ncbi:MAG: hypothetical protein R3A10_06685 [Caldilineaceae bacterium]